MELATEEEIQELEERSHEAQKNSEMKLEQEKNEPVIVNDNELTLEHQATMQKTKIDAPKLGRNEIVKITNGKEIKELKYKKAKSLIETEGWKIV